jgi:hypothetical protein
MIYLRLALKGWSVEDSTSVGYDYFGYNLGRLPCSVGEKSCQPVDLGLSILSSSF